MPRSMPTADRLARAMGRGDEKPNVALAEEIVASGDQRATADLVDILHNGKRAARGDAVKVLCEIAQRQPALTAAYLPDFLTQMESSNNRLVWGSITAIAYISQVEPVAVCARLPEILAAADQGSVIAKDQAIRILATLAASSETYGGLVPIMCERLQACAINQLPMYAEQIAAAVAAQDRPAIARVLQQRMVDDMPPSKRKRLTKVTSQLLHR